MFGECVWNVSGMCPCLILSPECLWIILNVSGMLDKASESVWRMCLECVWNVSGASYFVLNVSGSF